MIITDDEKIELASLLEPVIKRHESTFLGSAFADASCHYAQWREQYFTHEESLFKVHNLLNEWWNDTFYYAEPVLRSISADGIGWRDSLNRRWIWRGFTNFLLFKKFLDGEDIIPLIDECKELGANLVRVLGMCSKITNFNPASYGNRYWTGLEVFAGILKGSKLYLEFTVFADAQDIIHDINNQKNHFSKAIEVLRVHDNTFIELVNEYPKNGISPGNFTQPIGINSSQGSNLSDAVGPRPGWTYHTFHGRRSWPKVLLSSIDPAVFIARGIDVDNNVTGLPKPFIHDEPIGFAEVNISGRRSNDPKLAAELAYDSLKYGGGTFHSESGIRSEPLGPVQKECARAWFNRMVI